MWDPSSEAWMYTVRQTWFPQKGAPGLPGELDRERVNRKRNKIIGKFLCQQAETENNRGNYFRWRRQGILWGKTLQSRP